MPLMKYFVFVGSALVLLLLAMNWLLPNPRPNLFTAATRSPSSGSVQSRHFPKEWSSIQVCRIWHRLRALCEVRHGLYNRRLHLKR